MKSKTPLTTTANYNNGMKNVKNVLEKINKLQLSTLEQSQTTSSSESKNNLCHTHKNITSSQMSYQESYQKPDQKLPKSLETNKLIKLSKPVIPVSKILLGQDVVSDPHEIVIEIPISEIQTEVCNHCSQGSKQRRRRRLIIKCVCYSILSVAWLTTNSYMWFVHTTKALTVSQSLLAVSGIIISSILR
jgi:hypothetical protein